LAPASATAQTVQTTASNTGTTLHVAGKGTGVGQFSVAGDGAAGYGNVSVQGTYSGAQHNVHTLNGAAGVSFDLRAAAGPGGSVGIVSDGQGNLNVGNYLSGGIIAITGISAQSTTLAITNNLNVFTGSSATTWTLPDVAFYIGTPIIIKNAGTGTLTVNADAGSDIVTTTQASAVSSTTVASGAAL
jgi:hypothetical protein